MEWTGPSGRLKDWLGRLDEYVDCWKASTDDHVDYRDGKVMRSPVVDLDVDDRPIWPIGFGSGEAGNETIAVDLVWCRSFEAEENRNRPASDVVTTVQPSPIVGHGTREMV